MDFTNLLNECKVICLHLPLLSSFSPLPIWSNVLANDLAKSAYNEEGSGAWSLWYVAKTLSVFLKDGVLYSVKIF